MKISLVAPYYNIPEIYFKPFVESVLSQDYDNYELIIVNDGSNKEDCLALLSELDDPHIRVISKMNGGVSSARNLGMSIIEGDVLLFADPDDELLPGLLRHLADTFTENPDTDMIYFNHLKESRKGGPREDHVHKSGKYTGKECFDGLCLHGVHFMSPYVWDKALRIRGREKLIAFDEEMVLGEDELWLMQMLPGISNVIFSSFRGYYYKRNPEGAFTNKSNIDSRICKNLNCYEKKLDMIAHLEGKDACYYGTLAKARIALYRAMEGLLRHTEQPSPNWKILSDKLAGYSKELRGHHIDEKAHRVNPLKLSLLLLRIRLSSRTREAIREKSEDSQVPAILQRTGKGLRIFRKKRA